MRFVGFDRAGDYGVIAARPARGAGQRQAQERDLENEFPIHCGRV